MLKTAQSESESGYFEFEGAVLPVQVRLAVNTSHARSGERLLMLAVLTDAINIFLKATAERRLWSDTRNWIRSVSSDCHTITFEDACDAVGLDPAALRERLFRLKYGGRGADLPRRRCALTLKPPATSRGPVKVAPMRSRGSVRRGRASI